MLETVLPGVLVTGRLMKGGSVGVLAAVVVISGAVFSCRGEEALWSL